MNKKIFVLIGGFALIIFVCILYIASFIMKAPEINTSISVTIVPTIIKDTVIPSFSVNQQKEKILEENYAKERQIFLNEKPWVLSLPLVSDNFFISYDPENSRFLVSIYYTSSDPSLKEEQLDIAKQEALEELKKINTDLNKEGILFKEVKKITPVP